MVPCRGTFHWGFCRYRRAYLSQLSSRIDPEGRASSRCGRPCPQETPGRRYPQQPTAKTASSQMRLELDLIQEGRCPCAEWDSDQSRYFESSRQMTESLEGASQDRALCPQLPHRC